MFIWEPGPAPPAWPRWRRARPARRRPAPFRAETAWPPANEMTASSVTSRSILAQRGQRQRALLDDLGRALGGVLHGDDDALGAGDEVHRAAHAGHHLAGDHPVRQVAGLVDLQAAEHGDVEVAAADQAERDGAVERGRARQRGDRLAGGVGEEALGHAFFGNRPGADQAVLRLEVQVHAGAHVIGDLGRNADAEVHQHAVGEFLGDAFGDDGLRVHGGISSNGRRRNRPARPASRHGRARSSRPGRYGRRRRSRSWRPSRSPG